MANPPRGPGKGPRPAGSGREHTRRGRKAEKKPLSLRVRGGRLGLRDKTRIQLARAVQEGISYQSVEAVRDFTGLPEERIARVAHIATRTLARRRKEGRLTVDESEGVLRLALLMERATDLFEGDVEGARRWLSTPKAALDGSTPFELAETEIGGREVEDLLYRLEHGVYS